MRERQYYKEELRKHREHFHKYPELALKEIKTSEYIRKHLEEWGYQIQSVPPTGLIAEHPVLRKNEKILVLRAEMDALPIQEQTGLPFASVHEGCMHACGHDGILATALTLAKLLSEEADTFPINVRFLFEPAEEIGEGAQRMLDAGAMDAPVPDAFLMFHYAADMPLGMAVHQGQTSAMIGSIQIEVHGKSSHWSEAHKGIDSIYTASKVIQYIHELNETYERKAPCLVGIGTVHGGEYPNIIADYVKLNGNIRACREEDFYGLYEQLESAFAAIEKETGTIIEMKLTKDPVLAFANDEALTKTAVKVGKELFGERFILEGEDEVFLAGDNAYRYFLRTKGLFVIFLAALPGKSYPLHHPKYVLDEEILPYSLEALYKIIFETASDGKEK